MLFPKNVKYTIMELELQQVGKMYLSLIDVRYMNSHVI